MIDQNEHVARKHDNEAELEPGFKMTQIGLLPEDWAIEKVGDKACLIMGQSPPSTTYNIVGEGTPFLQGKAEFGDIYPTPEKYCSVPIKKAPKDAVLISVRAPVGDVNIAPYEICIGRGLAAIQPNKDLNVRFLFYWLMHAKTALEEQSSGSTFKSINKGVLRDFKISLPRLYEQCGIVYTLNAVQQGIEATGKVIDAARELEKSLMRHLFTYGPVPLDRADQVPLRETEIGLMPEHWDPIRLREIAQTTSGGTPSRKRPDYYCGDIPWVKSGELEDGPINRPEESITRLGLKESSAKVFPKGTLVVALYGATAGKVGILSMDAATNQAVCAVFPEVCKARPDYLFRAFIKRREELLGERYGGAQPNISQTILKEFRLPLPPLPEQQQIARILKAVDRKIEAEKNRRRALEAIFKTLLHYLMTGKIRVRDIAEKPEVAQ